MEVGSHRRSRWSFTNQLMAQRLFEQTFANWVNPELEKRKSERRIGGAFVLRAAQVIFSVGAPPIVRLNSEVKAIAEAKLNKSVKRGDQIFAGNIEDIRSFRLIDEEKDFAHITIIRLSKGWHLGFSFIYDVSKAKEFYEIAVEFLTSARSELKEKRYRALTEAAVIAAENLFKARIYFLPDSEIKKAKTHGLIQAKVNIYSRGTSIVKPEHKDVFNELLSLRDEARYKPGFNLEYNKAEEIVKTLEELSQEVSSYLVRFQETSGGV